MGKEYEQIIHRLEIANQNECCFIGNWKNAYEKNCAITGLINIKTVLIGGLFGKQFGRLSKLKELHSSLRRRLFLIGNLSLRLKDIYGGLSIFYIICKSEKCNNPNAQPQNSNSTNHGAPVQRLLCIC